MPRAYFYCQFVKVLFFFNEIKAFTSKTKKNHLVYPVIKASCFQTLHNHSPMTSPTGHRIRLKKKSSRGRRGVKSVGYKKVGR